MNRRFNTTGLCIPRKHYMVDIIDKLNEIEKLIENEFYFLINRPRQYGKTTTLNALENKLIEKYLVTSLSFEGIGDIIFDLEDKFCQLFIRLMADSIELQHEEYAAILLSIGSNVSNIAELSKAITKFIKTIDKEVILIIDEVDKVSNNQLFLSFLGMLRNKYLQREAGKDYTFKAVILAGVYDVRNLKIKVRSENEQKYNSPWNIAVDFNVDMSFKVVEIASMLSDYSKDYELNFDVNCISKEIYKFTSGYPFLVSKICQIIHENILKGESRNWTVGDVQRAVKVLLEDKNTLFDDLIKNLENNNELYELIYKILILAAPVLYNRDNPVIDLGVMFGYLVKDSENYVIISNQIIKERIYNYMISKTDKYSMEGYNFKNNFITENNGLDMNKILLRFQQFMKENYSSRDTEFLERHGVLLFLSFIKPIINGVGFDYKEVQISEERRLDIVIQYNNFKYVIETKIWHGDAAHEKGLKQLANYLDIEGLDSGYLLIFNFNKSKEYTNEAYRVGHKEIFQVIV